MKQVKLLTYFLLIITLTAGCSLLKKHEINTEKQQEIALKKQIISNNIKVDYFKAKYQAQIYGNGINYKLNGSINIICDSMAKINAISNFGLPIAKIIVKKDSTFISSMFFPNLETDNKNIIPSLSIGPNQLCDLFLGNYIRFSDTVDIMQYSMTTITDSSAILLYRIPSKSSPQLSDFANQLIFSFKKNKITKNQFWKFTSDKAISIEYLNFNYIEKQKIPFKIKIKMIEGTDTIFTNILLKNIRIK